MATGTMRLGVSRQCRPTFLRWCSLTISRRAMGISRCTLPEAHNALICQDTRRYIKTKGRRSICPMTAVYMYRPRSRRRHSHQSRTHPRRRRCWRLPRHRKNMRYPPPARGSSTRGSALLWRTAPWNISVSRSMTSLICLASRPNLRQVQSAWSITPMASPAVITAPLTWRR